MIEASKVNSVEVAESPETDTAANNIEIEVRVRYPECDPMNVVHHAVYPVWMEMARTELLRKRGFTYRNIEVAGHFFAVAKLNVKYLKPAFYDDLLTIKAEIKPTAGVKIEHLYEIHRGNEIICRGETTVVCVDRNGKLQPIPEILR
ncbi:Acyl-CoA thioester hydrolase YbgC [Poriferisphaera corsica]|uniref:Acyl-CoA thioester hydrolase YbgC n=2 Tax=Poriferisphaera corsica TaxID=2528020 RepID=A0A517YTQ1_9BACT|nr:Acyl-CoA thioester hydrolase YbgC [Poriferisphaera corsica]